MNITTVPHKPTSR